MSQKSKWEYLKAIYSRYRKASKEQRALILDEFCQVCGYIYDPAKGDPDSGVAPGTPFESLPDDWVCPECGAGKDQFVKVEE